MSWWDNNDLRLIQTNISELNANLNVDNLVERLKDFSANVLLLNTGGIESFYPTELKYHYQSPYLKQDLVGKMVEKCHENNIKYMARFDFSKAHISIYKQHPEWFYKSNKDEIIDYNDMVHTCVNGYYQQKYSLKIIDEVINKYPIDGIFFNMFGYQTTDYSGNYYGICHCDNCKKRFYDMFNCDLPKQEDPDDPVYQKYIKFKQITVNQMLENIHDLVKNKSKNIAISTYAHHKIDIVKKESNTDLSRPYPHWLYSASENVKSVEDSWEDKLISNVCINAVGLDYRFMGVSKHQVAIRLYESLASGSGLDFCIIGDFASYPETENFATVKKIYRLHQNNQKYFGNFKSVSEILLIKPEKFLTRKQELEYKGLFKMLKEEHILFDVVCQQNLNYKLKDIKNYRLIIMPGLKNINNEEFLSEIEKNNVHVIATSFYGESDSINKFFAVKNLGQFDDTRSAYIEVEDKAIFKRFKLRDWVFVKDMFAKIGFSQEYKKYLPLLSPARFGPPERVGGHEKTGFFGLGINESKYGKKILIPWNIGFIYYQHGYLDHKKLFIDVLDYVLNNQYIIKTNAPETVEIFLNKYNDHTYNLQLVNLSGFNGTSYHEPQPVHDINIRISNLNNIGKINSLLNNDNLNFSIENGNLNINLSKLNEYEILILN